MSEENAVRIDYQGNSNKAKQEQLSAEKENKDERVKLDPIAKGVQRKKPLGRKIAETFKGDDAESIGTYVLFDVVIPAAKNMFADALIQGVERALFGEASTSRRSGSYRSGSMGNSNNGPSKYQSPFQKMQQSSQSNNVPRNWSNQGRRTHDFDEILLPNRGIAEKVLDALAEKIDKFDVASVADLLDLVDVSSNYVDNKYGWTRQSFVGADIILARNGYILDLPRPIALD
ncbi:hypothetical protein SEA_ARCADIA_53 [Arthrobacter phage Arcadia]|uniref:Uncharacterized protein n=2 Tax=Mudcatvirus TaxID=1982088 RepID=A0A222Z880_9CAUD|nr:hypothetical protein PQB74_gp53 [Arthrobacter phage Arcadia]YP_010666339.1 hypothetical protein PQB77_gp51 [Arthrobacter phage Correa]ASR80209.1 hypothetical protein SEA_ELSA_53 [Arthrobacter phage Elsa]ASR80406.1 hypothetical protein SEA_NASON_53 [Arthrobacter phage Nason]ASR80016.1 hypothetical protein SEA_ARCADIA_53 [Arthrobacter phage Arcadia]ASR80112.1 hypothetical protein SEA_CORREA_51 [Arthrobacter phage Correa]